MLMESVILDFPSFFLSFFLMSCELLYIDTVDYNIIFTTRRIGMTIKVYIDKVEVNHKVIS